jgi:hypothetical protein
MHNEQAVFVMEVAEKLPFADYWNDKRFHSRRPDGSGCPVDNIYKPGSIDPQGRPVMKQVENCTHDICSQAHDLSGVNVLVAKRFWYFGDKSEPMPDILRHLLHQRQGYSVHKNRRPDDVARLKEWLATFRKNGRLGRPIDSASRSHSSCQPRVREATTPTRGIADAPRVVGACERG